MAIEIVHFPIKNGDFPWQNVSSPEGNGYLQANPVFDGGNHGLHGRPCNESIELVTA